MQVLLRVVVIVTILGVHVFWAILARAWLADRYGFVRQMRKPLQYAVAMIIFVVVIDGFLVLACYLGKDAPYEYEDSQDQFMDRLESQM